MHEFFSEFSYNFENLFFDCFQSYVQYWDLEVEQKLLRRLEQKINHMEDAKNIEFT